MQSLHLCYSKSVAIQPCPIIVSRVAILPNPQQSPYLHIVSRVAMMPNPQQSSAGPGSMPQGPDVSAAQRVRPASVDAIIMDIDDASAFFLEQSSPDKEYAGEVDHILDSMATSVSRKIMELNILQPRDAATISAALRQGSYTQGGKAKVTQAIGDRITHVNKMVKEKRSTKY